MPREFSKEQLKVKMSKLEKCHQDEAKAEFPDQNTFRAIRALQAKYNSELVKAIQEEIEADL